MSSSPITPRQVEVLECYARGMKPGEVAEKLGISKRAMWDVLGRARAALGARTNTEAVALVVALGLVETKHGQNGRLRRAWEHLSEATRLIGEMA